jgi:hypothetical protein
MKTFGVLVLLAAVALPGCMVLPASEPVYAAPRTMVVHPHRDYGSYRYDGYYRPAPRWYRR